MQVWSQFTYKGMGAALEGATTQQQRDALRQSTLPKPCVIFESERLRVTMRYNETDWKACYIIEEKRTDAMNGVAWSEIDAEFGPLQMVLSAVFDFLVATGG